MRGLAPSAGEPISGPYKRGLICSLHVGSARGVTTWDEPTDVCWLLGYNEYHRNGDPNDAYNVFNDQFSTGVLLPTQDDWYAALADEEDDFLERLLDTGTRLLERARANPGHEEVETYTDGGQQVMCIDLLIEADGLAEEGWLGITLPQNEHLSDADLYNVVAQLIPCDAQPIYSKTFKDRARRRGEIVYKWDFYDPTPS